MAPKVLKANVVISAEVLPLANGLQEGTAEAAPPMPTTQPLSGGWFTRTWHYLFDAHLLNDPDEIVAYSHTSRNVTIRLATGHEYCIDKERL